MGPVRQRVCEPRQKTYEALRELYREGDTNCNIHIVVGRLVDKINDHTSKTAKTLPKIKACDHNWPTLAARLQVDGGYRKLQYRHRHHSVTEKELVMKMINNLSKTYAAEDDKTYPGAKTPGGRISDNAQAFSTDGGDTSTGTG